MKITQIERVFTNFTKCFSLRMIHIGNIIEEELHKQERTVTWLAKNLCCDRTNVYKIFKKQSIDTELLLRISLVMNVNFFECYKTELHNVDIMATHL